MKTNNAKSTNPAPLKKSAPHNPPKHILKSTADAARGVLYGAVVDTIKGLCYLTLDAALSYEAIEDCVFEMLGVDKKTLPIVDASRERWANRKKLIADAAHLLFVGHICHFKNSHPELSVGDELHILGINEKSCLDTLGNSVKAFTDTASPFDYGRIIGNLVGPFIIGKGAAKSFSALQNMRRFGTLKQPRYFQAITTKDFDPLVNVGYKMNKKMLLDAFKPMKNAKFNEVRMVINNKKTVWRVKNGKLKVTYAISTEGDFIVGPSAYYSRKGVRLDVKHIQLLKKKNKSAVLAGDFALDLTTGKIDYANSSSGHLKPYGNNLEEIFNHCIIKSGFSDTPAVEFINHMKLVGIAKADELGPARPFLPPPSGEGMAEAIGGIVMTDQLKNNTQGNNFKTDNDLQEKNDLQEENENPSHEEVEPQLNLHIDRASLLAMRDVLARKYQTPASKMLEKMNNVIRGSQVTDDGAMEVQLQHNSHALAIRSDGSFQLTLSFGAQVLTGSIHDLMKKNSLREKLDALSNTNKDNSEASDLEKLIGKIIKPAKLAFDISLWLHDRNQNRKWEKRSDRVKTNCAETNKKLENLTLLWNQFISDPNNKKIKNKYEKEAAYLQRKVSADRNEHIALVLGLSHKKHGGLDSIRVMSEKKIKELIENCSDPAKRNQAKEIFENHKATLNKLIRQSHQYKVFEKIDCLGEKVKNLIDKGQVQAAKHEIEKFEEKVKGKDASLVMPAKFTEMKAMCEFNSDVEFLSDAERLLGNMLRREAPQVSNVMDFIFSIPEIAAPDARALALKALYDWCAGDFDNFKKQFKKNFEKTLAPLQNPSKNKGDLALMVARLIDYGMTQITYNNKPLSDYFIGMVYRLMRTTFKISLTAKKINKHGWSLPEVPRQLCAYAIHAANSLALLPHRQPIPIDGSAVEQAEHYRHSELGCVALQALAELSSIYIKYKIPKFSAKKLLLNILTLLDVAHQAYYSGTNARHRAFAAAYQNLIHHKLQHSKGNGCANAINTSINTLQRMLQQLAPEYRYIECSDINNPQHLFNLAKIEILIHEIARHDNDKNYTEVLELTKINEAGLVNDELHFPAHMVVQALLYRLNAVMLTNPASLGTDCHEYLMLIFNNAPQDWLDQNWETVILSFEPFLKNSACYLVNAIHQANDDTEKTGLLEKLFYSYPNSRKIFEYLDPSERLSAAIQALHLRKFQMFRALLGARTEQTFLAVFIHFIEANAELSSHTLLCAKMIWCLSYKKDTISPLLHLTSNVESSDEYWNLLIDILSSELCALNSDKKEEIITQIKDLLISVPEEERLAFDQNDTVREIISKLNSLLENTHYSFYENGYQYNFQPVDVPHDGDCGFHVLGLTRLEAIQCLSEQINQMPDDYSPQENEISVFSILLRAVECSTGIKAPLSFKENILQSLKQYDGENSAWLEFNQSDWGIMDALALLQKRNLIIYQESDNNDGKLVRVTNNINNYKYPDLEILHKNNHYQKLMCTKVQRQPLGVVFGLDTPTLCPRRSEKNARNNSFWSSRDDGRRRVVVPTGIEFDPYDCWHSGSGGSIPVHNPY